jgi:hypothetical protein
MEIRAFFLAALLSAGAAAAAQPHATSFAQAQKLFDFQAKDAATKAYANAWAEFNNAHHLDEKGGCYSKAGGTLVQILEIDATGRVVGYFANRDNARSRCWRQAYLGVKFPPPPFAPFYHRLEMG